MSSINKIPSEHRIGKVFDENGFVCAYLMSQHNCIFSCHQLMVWQFEEFQTCLEKREFANFTKM